MREDGKKDKNDGRHTVLLSSEFTRNKRINDHEGQVSDEKRWENHGKREGIRGERRINRANIETAYMAYWGKAGRQRKNQRGEGDHPGKKGNGVAGPAGQSDVVLVGWLLGVWLGVCFGWWKGRRKPSTRAENHLLREAERRGDAKKKRVSLMRRHVRLSVEKENGERLEGLHKQYGSYEVARGMVDK